MQKRKIILASKSPRRKMLLKQIGLKFEVVESNYHEDMAAIGDPYELAKFLALGKAKEVAKKYKNAIIIGADTFTVFKNDFIGKPKDKDDARRILKNFSGQEHKVISGIAIIDTKDNKIVQEVGETTVKFRNLDNQEIDDYIETGEPLEAAGGYNMTDRGVTLIEGINGDYSVVVGFPLSKLYLELKKMGAV